MNQPITHTATSAHFHVDKTGDVKANPRLTPPAGNNVAYLFGIENPPSSVHQFHTLARPLYPYTLYTPTCEEKEVLMEEARRARTEQIHKAVVDLVRFVFGHDWGAELVVFKRPAWKVKVTFDKGPDDVDGHPIHANRPWAIYETVDGEQVADHITRTAEWKYAQALACSIAQAGPGPEAMEAIACSDVYEIYDDRGRFTEKPQPQPQDEPQVEPQVLPWRPGWEPSPRTRTRTQRTQDGVTTTSPWRGW